MQDSLSIIDDYYYESDGFGSFDDEIESFPGRKLQRRKTHSTLVNVKTFESQSYCDAEFRKEMMERYSTNTKTKDQLSIMKSLIELIIQPLEWIEMESLFDDIVREKRELDVRRRQMRCYAYSCSDTGCYSVCCPKKNTEKIVNASCLDGADTWSEYVPQTIHVSTTEQKRQEKIYELIQTEKQYVMDLKNTIDFYLLPLRESDIMPTYTVDQIFLNIEQVYKINSDFLEQITARQQESFVVDSIGDLVLSFSNKLQPYVTYGGSQPLAKSILAKECLENPRLVQFLQETQKLPCFRKLSLNSFLAAQITRLGRYPLLLGDIIKHTDTEELSAFYLEVAKSKISSFLAQVDEKAGITSNAVLLDEFRDKIFMDEEYTKIVKLGDGQRRLIRFGDVINKKLSESEVTLFMFDHMLLITKKLENGYQVTKKPIPIELVNVNLDSNAIPQNISILIPNKKLAFQLNAPNHYGSGFTFLAPSESHVTSWVNEINKQREIILQDPKYFKLNHTHTFPYDFKVHCIERYGDEMFIGTDSGLFVTFQVSSTDSSSIIYSKILGFQNIYKILIVPEFDRVYVLADKTLLYYSLNDMIRKSHRDPTVTLLGEKVYSNVKDIQSMTILDENQNELQLLCTLKSSNYNSTLKIEAIDPDIITDGLKHLFRKFDRSFKPVEFNYKQSGSSIQIIGNRVIITLLKTFDSVIVKYDQVSSAELFDESDRTMSFLNEKAANPIQVFKTLDKQFIICYDDQYGTFLNQLISWIGKPKRVVLEYPYIIGFDTEFIEVHDIVSGEFKQIIPASGSRHICDRELTMVEQNETRVYLLEPLTKCFLI